MTLTPYERAEFERLAESLRAAGPPAAGRPRRGTTRTVLSVLVCTVVLTGSGITLLGMGLAAGSWWFDVLGGGLIAGCFPVIARLTAPSPRDPGRPPRR